MIFLSAIIFTSSCTGDDENVQKSVIRDILQQIQSSFIQRDLEKIMSFYHPDFFHKGNNIHSQSFIWQDRINRFVELDIEFIDIEIRNDYAMAIIKITFTGEHQSLPTYIDHETEGDLSYFFHDHRDWRIIGNGMSE